MLNTAPITAVLPAKDLARAKKFYSEILGLSLSAKQEPGGVTFDCGQGTKLYIYERPAVKTEHTQASFEVHDLEGEMQALRTHGVVFEEYDTPGLKTENGIATLGDYKAAWFKDTEGNILAMGQG